MSLADSVCSTMRGMACEAAARTLLAVAESVAAMVGTHDPRHLARARRRGREAQRALMAWATARGLRVDVPALSARQRVTAAARLAAAGAFLQAATEYERRLLEALRAQHDEVRR